MENTVKVTERTIDVKQDDEIGLFTSLRVDDPITEDDIIEPSGLGYLRKKLSDVSWRNDVTSAVGKYYAKSCSNKSKLSNKIWSINDIVTYAWTAGRGGWGGAVCGYFICKKASDGTKYIVHFEVDPTGPKMLTVENDQYLVRFTCDSLDEEKYLERIEKQAYNDAKNEAPT